MQAYWLVVRVLLTPPAEAAAGQKWKIICLQVLIVCNTKNAWWLLVVIRRHPQARPAPIELKLTPN
ncbi:MAG: hypothetical protein ABIL62_04685 [Planctomycetota bacterium]